MTLPVQHGLASDVPVEKVETTTPRIPRHVRRLAADLGTDAATLAEKIPADTLRRLRESDVIAHVNEDGTTTYVRDVVAGRGVEGGPIQSAAGKDTGAHSAIPEGKDGTGATAVGNEPGPTRDSSGRFTSRRKS